MQIRRFIHEQNAVPGVTNRLLAHFVDQVFISLEQSRRLFPKEKTLLTGNPIRKEIAAAVENPPHPTFDKGGCLTGRGDFRLLVFGGSAGAHSINLNMIAALPHLQEVRGRLAITHQTGENDLEEVRAAYARKGFSATVVPFIDDMAEAYRGSNLVICRAGATTIAEVTACGRACIFIPYPHAVDDHQRQNAEALLKEGAGFMLLERELSGERLAQQIRELLADPQTLAAAGAHARELARPDAARVIVDEMLKDEGYRH
jgi:UDP-N-acetylglucosamine--N-acetylmuramyl-(pentapeptide) pyrophosphoryl-undecaprenol N-acetylglucosamine transferase